jgi:hypothetical protein
MAIPKIHDALLAFYGRFRKSLSGDNLTETGLLTITLHDRQRKYVIIFNTR